MLRHKRGKKKEGKKVRYRTNAGHTENLQTVKMSRMRRKKKHMDSEVNYPDIKWAILGSQEYLDAITAINKAYRKMLEIGKSQETFRQAKGDVLSMLTADSKINFKKAEKANNRRYDRHIKANKGTLKNFRVNTEFIPHPKKYANLKDKRHPTNRETMIKEQVLTFEQYLSMLNIFKCSVCLECNIEAKPFADDPNYVCGGCKTRNDPLFFIKNNLHPVWYLVDDNGQWVLDEHGERCTQYHIPDELSCLSMYEKLLIRRCANFVPTIHLKNGIFASKGHSVTFPQDITEMCNELPQRQETILTFIRNIGNKDKSAVFPTSLRVNRKKIINALLWLKKHNIFYKNIQIKEENLDWMEGKEEVNVGMEGLELNIKDTPRSKKQDEEEEYVSKSHCTEQDVQDENLTMRTVHANEKITIPSGRQAEPIKRLIEIAKKTNQTAKVMNFPPIDHDSPIS